MAEEIKKTYPPVQEAAIASFSAEELASGIGVVNFYAVKGTDPDGNINALTEFTVSSFPVETQVDTTTTIFTFTSSVFNLPRYVKGTAYATVNLYQESGSTTATVKIQHWDGTTPTDLTGSATATLSGTPGRATFYVEIPITTEKMVKKGEMLRAVVTVISSANAYVGHSPDDAAGALNTQGTRLTVGVPFRRGI